MPTTSLFVTKLYRAKLLVRNRGKVALKVPQQLPFFLLPLCPMHHCPPAQPPPQSLRPSWF